MGEDSEKSVKFSKKRNFQTKKRVHFRRGKRVRKAPRLLFDKYVLSKQWKRKSEKAKRDLGFKCQECQCYFLPEDLIVSLPNKHRIGRERLRDFRMICLSCSRECTDKYKELQSEFFAIIG